MGRYIKAVWIIISALTIFTSFPGIAGDTTTSRPPLTPAEVLKENSAAVVLIMGLREGEQVVQGTGFIISPDGMVVSNYHVVKGAYPALVKLANGDVYDQITVINWDARKDIAILKITGFNLPTVTLGDSDKVEIGEPLIVIGNPLGLEQSISDGLLSGLRDLGGYRVHQISVPISGGSSGSPVFNEYGEVIGVAFASIENGQNLNFSIPINYARGLLGAPREISLENFAKLDETSGVLAPNSITEASREEALISLGKALTKISAGGQLAQIQIEWRVAGYYNNVWSGKEWRQAIIPPEAYRAQSLFHEAAAISSDNSKTYPKDIRVFMNKLAGAADKFDNTIKILIESADRADNQTWNQAWMALHDASIELGVIIDGSKTLIEEARSSSQTVKDALPKQYFYQDPSATRGYVGIGILQDEGPLAVLWIGDASPAKKSLKIRDVLLGVVGGVSFENSLDFYAFMNQTRPGQELRFRIMRDGKEIEVPVILGKLP